MKCEAAGQQIRSKEINSYVEAAACTPVDSCREFIFFFFLQSQKQIERPSFLIFLYLLQPTNRHSPRFLCWSVSLSLEDLLFFQFVFIPSFKLFSSCFQLLFISSGLSLLFFPFKSHLIVSLLRSDLPPLAAIWGFKTNKR